MLWFHSRRSSDDKRFVLCFLQTCRMQSIHAVNQSYLFILYRFYKTIELLPLKHRYIALEPILVRARIVTSWCTQQFNLYIDVFGNRFLSGLWPLLEVEILDCYIIIHRTLSFGVCLVFEFKIYSICKKKIYNYKS